MNYYEGNIFENEKKIFVFITLSFAVDHMQY
jgi:hypothetical protein